MTFGGDFHRWKTVAVFDHQSRVLAQILQRPDVFLNLPLKIVRHKPVDIPTSSATSWTVSRQFPQIMFFTWVIRSSDLEVESQPDRSSSSVELLLFLKRLNHLKVLVRLRASLL
jgi:hypothetical protein